MVQKKNKYNKLKNAIDQYITGEISAADLKHTAAPCGIYQQRNNLFMLRLRVVGGELTVSQLQDISGVMKKYDIGFSHLTTRQDLQLHDVKPEDIYPVVIELTEKGMPFRGGGGNTFRNIIVSTKSGISPDTVFDVFPHAVALNEYIMTYDKAFDLPRKFKIGFSSSESDTIHADLQDLGFIAKRYSNEKGFTVYGGGGMGKESRYGVKLFEFLPEKKVAKCAKAIIDLFYDHGDRSNRNKARLRFVLNRLGEDAFINLFKEYYLKSFAELPLLKESNCAGRDARTTERCTSGDACTTEEEEAGRDARATEEEWLEYAVSETRFGGDVVSVKLFVPQGNLNSEHLDKIIRLLDIAGCGSLRISQSQDIVIPLVLKSALYEIYLFLNEKLNDIDLTLRSFKGHILSCIGSEVCKIGIVNAPEFADVISGMLDGFFTGKTLGKAKFINELLPEIRISGCRNACSGHFASEIGLYGMKKRVNGELLEGAVLKKKDEEDKFILLSDLPEKIQSLVN